jgi:AMMECR1 domain-containing protein
VLTVPKQQQNLQKLLSIYHPLKDIKYYEFDALEIAVDELDDREVQLDALNAAKEMDVDQAEAILRAEVGSSVSSMSSKELKRDLMLFARRSPDLFIELASDDNIMLRNFAIKATESGVIKLSQDQRVFTWASNGRKLMTVPFDEHPYSAMAAFFKTDEGLEIYKSIEKKIS